MSRLNYLVLYLILFIATTLNIAASDNGKPKKFLTKPLVIEYLTRGWPFAVYRPFGFINRLPTAG